MSRVTAQNVKESVAVFQSAATGHIMVVNVKSTRQRRQQQLLATVCLVQEIVHT